MSLSHVQRRLDEVSSRLRALRDELGVVDEQLAALEEAADDLRIKALVSETPMAGREHTEARRHADAMARHRATVVNEMGALERTQDELLDRLVAGSR